MFKFDWLASTVNVKHTSSSINPDNLIQIRPSVLETVPFLGLSSYYIRFIPGFAKLASPLHFFEMLKELLVTAPVLAYPEFGDTHSFVPETDTGGGAVLAQKKEDGQIHPIAYMLQEIFNLMRRGECLGSTGSESDVQSQELQVKLHHHILRIMISTKSISWIWELCAWSRSELLLHQSRRCQA